VGEVKPQYFIDKYVVVSLSFFLIVWCYMYPSLYDSSDAVPRVLRQVKQCARKCIV